MTSNRLELATTPADELAAVRMWEKAAFGRRPEVIALNPGAAFGAAKYWPEESFARLAQMLVDRRGSGILVLCGPKEAELARRIVAAADRPTVFSLAGEPMSIGLTMSSYAPSWIALTVDCMSSRAVTTTTVGGRGRSAIWVSTSKPLPPGRPRSRSIRSAPSAAATAPGASCAVATS